jgi:predicted Zn-dependent protease
VLATEPAPAAAEPLIPLLEQVAQDKMHAQAYLYLGKVYDILRQSGTADYFAAEYNYAIGQTALAKKILNKALKQNLRSDIKLRATDLEQKMKSDTRKKSLF